jgi:heme-NO-binding protein
MVGTIQKILLDMVEGEAGAGAVEEVKRRAGVPEDRIFRLDTVYPDAEWQRLLAAACEVLQVTREQAVELYADYFCRDAVKRWPTWFQMSHTSRELLERQPTIHNCFATGVRDPEARQAVTDKFRIEKLENEIVTHYRSPNQLCDLYEALARWIIHYYGEQATIWQTRCTRRGDPECEIHVRWEKDGTH